MWVEGEEWRVVESIWLRVGGIMPGSPFLMQTTLHSPVSTATASFSSVPDLPKVRALRSTLSKWQILVFWPERERPRFSAMSSCSSSSPHLWHQSYVVFLVSEPFWGYWSTNWFSSCWFPSIYLAQQRKLKAMLKQQSSETKRLWTYIKILFNSLRKEPAG